MFDGEIYQLWAVKIKTYLEDLDLWKVVEEDYEVHHLPNNLMTNISKEQII